MIGAIALGDGDDRYDGRKGHHTSGNIDGGAGKDTIYGGVDADEIRGQKGADVMSGGAGKDVFVYRSVAESSASSTNRDRITDFRHGEDKIDLAFIDAKDGGSNNKFAFDSARGTSSSAVAQGHVAWYWVDKAGTADDYTYVRINNDADATIESMIGLKGLISLTSGDFIL
jgi:Ca2+-binding RTX toxin-like protein